MSETVYFLCGAVIGAFGILFARWAWEAFLTRMDRQRFDAYQRVLSENVRAELRPVRDGEPNVRKGGA